MRIATCLSIPLLAAGQDAVLFRASLTRGPEAETARGGKAPFAQEGLRFDGDGARFSFGSSLTYDARGNLEARGGSIRFRYRPDGPLGSVRFPILLATHEQRSIHDYAFLRLEWDGAHFAASIRDRAYRDHRVTADSFRPAPDRWIAFAISWSERHGLELSTDGQPAVRAPGPMELEARLDQVGYLTRSVSPQFVAGTAHGGWISGIEHRAAPLDGIKEWLHRFGWQDRAGIPRVSSLDVRKLAMTDARAIRKFWWKAVDGKRDTVWPAPGHEGGYKDESKGYELSPAREPFDWIRLTGGFAGTIKTGDGARIEVTPHGDVDYVRIASPAAVDSLEIDRTSGMLAELACLRIERLPPMPAGQRSIGASPGGSPRWREFAVPAAGGVAGVRLRLDATPDAYYRFSVRDPVDESRYLIEMDVRAAGPRLEIGLRFPPVRAAGTLVVEAASSGAVPARVEVQIAAEAFETFRAGYVERRMLEIRDLFQHLSEARPWIRVSPQWPEASMRRECRVVDQLLRLLEEIRDPANRDANAYLEWMRASGPPPVWAEPPPPAGIPRWAWQQMEAGKLLQQAGSWWIANRQIANGEFGGGLADDTDLVQNWPGLAFLDGRVGYWSRSARAVLDACYREGMIAGGGNARRADPLHAYEEGINALAASFLLDYGNPVLFEWLMESARRMSELQGINAKGHRHFRSYAFGAGGAVEEGPYGREDVYSNGLMQPALLIAWYNGDPAANRWIWEKADALLDHWKDDRYPRLARSIFFADDRVASRGVPDLATYNLLWGAFDLTRDGRYLWLQRETIRGGDWLRAAAANGDFAALVGVDGLAEAAARPSRDPSFAQLQAIAGRVEDAQAIVWSDLSRNLGMYTEAEQFTDRVSLPSTALQRIRLGGVAYDRNRIYPGHAIGWENTGGQLAVRVRETGRDQLRATVFAAGSGQRRVTMRVWRLEPGRYGVSVDGRMSELELRRATAIPLDLECGREMEVRIRLLERANEPALLPDLALAVEELRDRSGLEVPVHNIGGAAAGPFRVRVFEPDGRLAAEQLLDGLAAPSDLRPRVALARFPGMRMAPGMRVEVHLDGGGPEVFDGNNDARVPGLK